MDNNQTIEMVQQYIQQGKDLSAFLSDYQTLASSGKTPLGLNRWQKSDKPRMEDFNEDNRIIDEKLRELSAEKAEKAISAGKVTVVDGISNYLTCEKNSSGRVFLTGQLNGSPIAEGATIATLPAGFRPPRTMQLPAIYYRSGSVTWLPGTIQINLDGSLIVKIATQTANYVFLSLSFMSA